MTLLPLSSRLTQSFSAFTRSLKRRRAYARLSQLDGHLLNDIGLTSVDVQAMRRMW